MTLPFELRRGGAVGRAVGVVVRFSRVLGALVVLVGLSWGSLPSSASAVVPYDTVVAPAGGVNGTVRATTIVGDTVVVGGTFTQAFSSAGVAYDRVNLAAFSLSTGELLTGWRADVNRAVSALGTDGVSVFVGGQFTTVNGLTRPRLAKLGADTGAVVAGFEPRVSGAVKAVEVAGADLYIGGSFANRVAKLDVTTGAARTGFAASADKPVYSLALHADTLYVGGAFTSLGGVARTGVGALSATTGAVVGPVFTFTSTPVFGLEVSPDGSVLYGGQQSNQLTAWTTTTGERRWKVGVDGNAQAVKYYDGVVYFGFHDGYEGDTTLKLLAVDPTTGAVDPTFRPAINSFYGVWSIDAAPPTATSLGGLVIGGAFTTVDGVAARRVAIFR